MAKSGKSTGTTLSYSERLAEAISRYRPEDREALFAFRKAFDESECVQYASDYFRWQFEQNPSTRDNAPQVWVYKKDGAVLGQQGGIPTELQIGDSSYRASWAVDWQIDAKVRGRGVGAALMATYINYNEVTLAVGITDDSYRSMRRGGWIDLGKMAFFVRPLDVARMMRARGRPGLGMSLGLVSNIALLAVDLYRWMTLKLASLRIVEIERFDERVDELWRCASRHYPVICRRDRSHLNWRYAEFPREGRYRLFYLLRRGTVVGYAILRMGSRHGVAAGYVVDFLCEPKRITSLFSACLLQFRTWRAAAVYCLHAGHQTEKALKRLGFARRESGSRLMVKPTRVADEGLELLRDRDAWFVTAGDSDADRPTGAEAAAWTAESKK